MKLLLFLGSGVSLPSGLPGVVQITEDLLGSTDSSAPNGSERSQDLGVADSSGEIHRLLQLLKELDGYYLESVGLVESKGQYRRSGAVFRSATTYEDLLYLVRRIIECGEGLLDDAPAGAFCDLVEQKAGRLLSGTSREERTLHLQHLARASSEFIQCHIARSLKAERAVGLDLIVQLAESTSLEQLDIVTLNHDTLVEDVLKQHRIAFADGFGPWDGDVRWYDDSVYDAEDVRVRVFKPHGSIDWYSYLRNGRAWPAITGEGVDPGQSRNRKGENLKSRSKIPSFLCGANKTIQYNNGIYSDMFYRFHEALRKHQLTIMSGYGWADIGISMKFDYWFDLNKSNKLLLLHQRPEELQQRSLVLACAYEAFVGTGQIVPILKWLCDTSLDNLSDYIDKVANEEIV